MNLLCLFMFIYDVYLFLNMFLKIIKLGYWDKSITISTKNEIEYSIFRNIDKLKLIYSLLESQFHLEAMVENNLLINYFPLHNDSYFEEDNPESTICRYNCKLNLHELYDHMIILSDLNINETVIYRIENDKKMDYILVDLRHLILILTSNLLLQKIN